MDNYNSYGPNVTYGQAGIPANGTSGVAGIQGGGVQQGSWTVQAYFMIGSLSVPTDPSHISDPATFGLTAGTGLGSTAVIADAAAGGQPGEFIGLNWGIPGTSSAGGETITLEITAYSGATYNSSQYRGHSEAFTMVTSANTSTLPNRTFTSMPAFSIYIVPEPSLFALSGIAAAALILIRKKQVFA